MKKTKTNNPSQMARTGIEHNRNLFRLRSRRGTSFNWTVLKKKTTEFTCKSTMKLQQTW